MILEFYNITTSFKYNEYMAILIIIMCHQVSYSYPSFVRKYFQCQFSIDLINFKTLIVI